jgi:hypothetical protein
MKKNRESKRAGNETQCSDQIAAYSQALAPELRIICEALQALITAALPDAASKVWHGSPVWFKDENPVVGYNATTKAVNLLFWNGQAFGEPGLQPVGKYRAAQAVFGDVAEIDSRRIRLWLKKAKSEVFESKAFVKKLREERQNA